MNILLVKRLVLLGCTESEELFVAGKKAVVANDLLEALGRGLVLAEDGALEQPLDAGPAVGVLAGALRVELVVELGTALSTVDLHGFGFLCLAGILSLNRSFFDFILRSGLGQEDEKGESQEDVDALHV